MLLEESTVWWLCLLLIYRKSYLQVDALGEWIIGIYLHKFTNNELEISMPHEAAKCGIENVEFIVSERVQENPDNSRAVSAFSTIFIIQVEYTWKKSSNFESAEAMVWWQWWVEFTHGYYTTTVVSSQPSFTWYKSANQIIGIRTVYESWIIKPIKQWSGAGVFYSKFGKEISDSSWFPINRGCALNMGSRSIQVNCNQIEPLYLIISLMWFRTFFRI